MTATETKMIAFHGDPAIKTKYLDRVAKHRKMDNLVRGATGTNGKGCAVWCTLNKYDHASYETELGIPRAIARLEDGLFESLPVGLAMEWPERFLAAIKPGADLSLVMAKFFVWLLVDPEHGVIKHAKKARTIKAIQDVADLYKRAAYGEAVPPSEYRSAYAAYAAYAAAAAAAAAYAAYAAAAADAYAYAAAAAAAAAAAYAAYDAYAAAAAAYAAAAAADAADAYTAAARSQARVLQADKLIELLEAA